MTRSGRRILGALSLLTAGVVSACSGDAQADGAPPEGFTRVMNVEVLPVRAGSFTEIIRLTGVVEAHRDVVVASEETGVVREILADRGRVVRQGQPLVRLEDRTLVAQLDQARAQAALARESWERRKRLWEEDQVGSELAYLEARYAAEQSEAVLEGLQARLERSTIRAPFAGVVEDRMVELGSMVMAGTSTVRVVSVDPVKVVGGVPERFAAEVSAGALASVTFDVYPGERFEARINFVGATVNPSNRTFPVELTLTNSGSRFKPQMVANIQVVRGVLEEAVTVPQDALVRVEEGFVVFVVEGEGPEARARVRPVRLGSSQQNRVVILEGLVPGERLVVRGQNQVAHGDRVTVVATRQEGDA